MAAPFLRKEKKSCKLMGHRKLWDQEAASADRSLPPERQWYSIIDPTAYANFQLRAGHTHKIKMIFYTFIFVGLSTLALLEVFPFKKISPVAPVILTAGAFWFLSFSRWENGTDWDAYHTIYQFCSNNSYKNVFSNGGIEPGYLLLNYLLGWANSYRLFLAIFGMLVISIKSIPILRYSPYIFISYLIYYSSMFGDIFFVRQSLAISICFLALILYADGNKKTSYWLVVLASTMHYSAIVLMIALRWKPEEKRTLKRDFLILAIVGITSFAAWETLTRYLASFSIPIQYIGDRINIYAIDNKRFSEAETPLRDAFRVAEILAIYIYLYSRKEYIIDKYSKIYNYLLHTYYLGTIIVCAFSFTAVTLVRLSTYFKVTDLLLFPIAIMSHKGYNKALVMCLIFLYSGMRLYLGMLPFYDLYVPFHFYQLSIP
jgi:hypothetical protein